MELVDMRHLKCLEQNARGGSTPPGGTWYSEKDKRREENEVFYGRTTIGVRFFIPQQLHYNLYQRAGYIL